MLGIIFSAIYKRFLRQLSFITQYNLLTQYWHSTVSLIQFQANALSNYIMNISGDLSQPQLRKNQYWVWHRPQVCWYQPGIRISIGINTDIAIALVIGIALGTGYWYCYWHQHWPRCTNFQFWSHLLPYFHIGPRCCFSTFRLLMHSDSQIYPICFGIGASYIIVYLIVAYTIQW